MLWNKFDTLNTPAANMNQRIYQIDAFTDQVFAGNPAAVCPLEHWLDDSLMQQIASENNLSETAFIVKNGEQYDIRWFTPTIEVDLCGHATLAAAYALLFCEQHPGDFIRFYSHRSGMLTVQRQGDLLTLDFPADVPTRIQNLPAWSKGFDMQPMEAWQGKTDLLLLFESEAQIRELQPQFDIIGQWEVRGVIATARGDSTDFVSRFFAPQSGVPEDPVTGSAHTTLTPFWGERLQKKELSAAQLSARGGRLHCRWNDERVAISGQARLYLRGSIEW